MTKQSRVEQIFWLYFASFSIRLFLCKNHLKIKKYGKINSLPFLYIGVVNEEEMQQNWDQSHEAEIKPVIEPWIFWTLSTDWVDVIIWLISSGTSLDITKWNTIQMFIPTGILHFVKVILCASEHICSIVRYCFRSFKQL